MLPGLGVILRRRGGGTRVADTDTIGPSVWHFRFRLKSSDRPPRVTSTRVGAMALSLRHAAMFDLTPEMAVFHIEAHTMLNDGTSFCFQNIYAPADLLTLEI